MYTRRGFAALLTACVLASVTGCKDSDSKAPSESSALAASPRLSADSVARVYWMGKERLGIQASAYYLMRIWQLPEIRKLETDTLGRLSVPPLDWVGGNHAAANTIAALLLPLVHDIVQAESYLEIRQPTNQAAEAVFAIRLGDAQARGWATNFTVAGSVLGIPVTRVATDHDAWSLQRQQGPRLIELTRVGGWTVVGSTWGEKNSLLAETVGRIKRQGAAFVPLATNCWLQADLDPVRISGALKFDWNLPKDLPRVSLVVTGDGANVITRGELNFPGPIEMNLEPWVVPTNLIRQPLSGFTAIRGIKPMLASWKAWHDLNIGEPPNQLFFWANDSSLETYMAVPNSDASSQVGALTDRLVEKGNPWLASHGLGTFQRSSNSKDAAWAGLPSLAPFIKAVNDDRSPMVFWGLISNTNVGINSLPAKLPFEVLAQTNLVCFDWEATGSRIESGVFIGQILRIALRHAQLPLESVNWLRGLEPRLGVCRTVVYRAETNQLSFERKSTLGLSAVELQLMADWLASSRFPSGLHSLLAAPDEQPAARR
jgi:hypothetical protein